MSTPCEWGCGCPNPAAYVMVIDPTVELCWATDDDTCPGHPYCAEHVAHVRRECPDLVASVRSLRAEVAR